MRVLKLHSVHGAESERSEASARDLAQVLEQSGEAVIVKDLNAVVTYWNREAAALYGFSAQEAIGQPLRKLYAAELSKAEYERLLERVRAGHPTSSTTERRKKSGEIIRVDLKTTPFPAHGASADALIRRSDIAVRRARTAGIEYALYSGKGETETPQRLILLAELRKAIKDDELLLYYQPKIDVRTRAISAVEALVRWPHPERGMVPPKDFVPQAERTGLIKPLTDWILGAAWKQIGHWQGLGIGMPIAVNVSPNNLRDPDLLKQLIALVPRRLDFDRFR